MNNTELDDLKRWLQKIFTDKLVIIVGSGLSCAEGLPSMWDLGKKLKIATILKFINHMAV